MPKTIASALFSFCLLGMMVLSVGAQHCSPSYSYNYSRSYYPSYGYGYRSYAPAYSYAPMYYAPPVYSAPAWQYFPASVGTNGYATTYYPSGYYRQQGSVWIHEDLGVIPLGNPVPNAIATTAVVVQPQAPQPPTQVVIQSPTAPSPPQISIQTPQPQAPPSVLLPQITSQDVETLQKLREFFAQQKK